MLPGWCLLPVGLDEELMVEHWQPWLGAIGVGRWELGFPPMGISSQKTMSWSQRGGTLVSIFGYCRHCKPMSTRWYRSKIVLVFLHILAWVIMFTLPTLFHREPDQQHVNFRGMFSIRFLILDACWILFFYFNLLVLIPRFLNRKRIGIYISLLVLLLAIFVVAINMFPREGERPGFHREYFFIIFPYLFIWAMSTVYWFVTDKIRTEQFIKERENENLKTELSFLRSQVSPHFLFNVLNNMVAMARLKSDMLEPSLIRLSGLMRYMLYESDEASVTLLRETEYVNSYIELQKIRYARSLFIKVDMDPGDSQRIEPMLLIPFIENAFKHGTSSIEDPIIEISLKISDGLIDFRVRNKYDPENEEIKDHSSGIGLPNVERRLKLLYDQKHILTINREHGWFTVSLQIKLH
jgi:two-component system, LytTR family, sensor kinase